MHQVLKVYNSLKKLYYLYFSKFVDGKLVIHNRHKNYQEYLDKQLEKTLDPLRIEKWKGDEWQIKVDGFRHIFEKKNKKEAICLGARTGQEVHVLRELGLNCVGIDLVDFPPYTIKGDIHNLQFEDSYCRTFISEMERVHVYGDDYSENVIND